MSFIPAGEIIGKKKHEVRTVVISDDPLLPDGEYSFLDLYCTDKKCDCRKAMFHVLYNGKLVSVVNYGWENEAYYRKWLRCDRDDSMPQEMVGGEGGFNEPGSCFFRWDRGSYPSFNE